MHRSGQTWHLTPRERQDAHQSRRRVDVWRERRAVVVDGEMLCGTARVVGLRQEIRAIMRAYADRTGGTVPSAILENGPWVRMGINPSANFLRSF